jgi:hypothetical protein
MAVDPAPKRRGSLYGSGRTADLTMGSLLHSAGRCPSAPHRRPELWQPQDRRHGLLDRCKTSPASPAFTSTNGRSTIYASFILAPLAGLSKHLREGDNARRRCYSTIGGHKAWIPRVHRCGSAGRRRENDIGCTSELVFTSGATSSVSSIPTSPAACSASYVVCPS